MLSSNILFSFKVKQFMSHSIYLHWVRLGNISCILVYLFSSLLLFFYDNNFASALNKVLLWKALNVLFQYLRWNMIAVITCIHTPELSPGFLNSIWWSGWESGVFIAPGGEEQKADFSLALL